MFVSSGQPTILHADLDSFYASVEQRDNPRLRGRPVLVGGGVVLAASYEAKARGVRTAMGGAQARYLCPDAIVVPPRMSAYAAASRAVFGVFRNTTPLVEGISIDEAFLDIGGLLTIAGPAERIAHKLRADVMREAGLPISVGAAGTKFLSKVASACAKPNGLLVVPVGSELEFLHPLPIERLWGVGKVTSAKLRRYGITTVGDIARTGETELALVLGRASARHLYALSCARDPRRVQPRQKRRSMGAQRALGRGEHRPEDLDAALMMLVDRVCRRMRAANRTGRTICLRFRFADYTRATRSHTLPQPTAETASVLAAARTILSSARPLITARGLTLIGVAIGNLDTRDGTQLTLPFGDHPEDDHKLLDAAVDGVWNRFGKASLTRGALLGRDPGTSVPLLPD
ncbi:DNA polymerase IV [Hoyosella sp. YIM 151337]|uniref:DNA polymerase IV n=1 Tax=Hoyosella sp. YIM 151337 TaxID=2992742 RepID=UPI0022356A64|nr:DNA polymerase IV [Hoyosella sp. YIM 151337]MCW4351705.1 DNA polymerase IV [Hoyosella sp. YIM 151337]